VKGCFNLLHIAIIIIRHYILWFESLYGISEGICYNWKHILWLKNSDNQLFEVFCCVFLGFKYVTVICVCKHYGYFSFLWALWILQFVFVNIVDTAVCFYAGFDFIAFGTIYWVTVCLYFNFISSLVLVGFIFCSEFLFYFFSGS
jgi:hypothetical protein